MRVTLKITFRSLVSRTHEFQNLLIILVNVEHGTSVSKQCTAALNLPVKYTMHNVYIISLTFNSLVRGLLMLAPILNYRKPTTIATHTVQ